MYFIIYQTAFIGDIILSTSMLKSLKDEYPQSSIIFITTPTGKNILENSKEIDSFIIYDKHGVDSGLSGIYKISKKIKEITKHNKSIYISPHRYIRASILGFLIGAEARAGFRNSAFSFLYNRVVPYDYGIHEIERNFMLLSAALPDRLKNSIPANPQLFPSEADVEKVKELISARFGKSGKLVSIAPGSVWKTKRWPEDYFNELIKLLVDKGYCLILIGGKEDTHLCETMSSNNVLNFIGRLSLLESAAAIGLTDIIVTNDSAPLHMASAMDVPAIAIFGSTTPSLGFGPLSSNSVVLENNDLECRPCGRHGGNRCKKKHFECMHNITPAMVLNEIKKIIER